MKLLTIGLLAACAAFGQNAKNAPAAPKISTTIDFVKIPSGEYMMGCLPTDKDCIEDEVPRHKVRITKSLEVGKYEVTQAQWEGVMGAEANPSEHKGPAFPVEMVTKADIQKFLDALNAKGDGFKYRLPTEAEWEYFARAGAEEPPRETLGDYAWYNKNSDDESHPVGLKKPNAWGLYDVLGNVREFVSDQAGYYDDFTTGEISIDPQGPQGRGGGGFGGGGGGFGGGRGKGGGRGGPPPGGPGTPPPGGPAPGGPDGAPPAVAGGPAPGAPGPGGAGPGGGPGGGGFGKGGPGGPGGGRGKGGPGGGPGGGGNAASGINPKGFDAKGRLAIAGAPQPVTRGGGWDNNAPFVRLSARYYYYDMELKLSDLGFRVVREAQAQ